MELLRVLVISAGAITGWEVVVRWWEGRKEVTTPPAGWDLEQSRAIRLVRLQRVVRDALPADPALDSPYQRELRDAAFGEQNQDARSD